VQGENSFTDENLKAINDYLSNPEGDESLKAQMRQTVGLSLWNANYFYNTTLGRGETTIADQGSMNGWMVFMMFLSYVMTYLCTFNGLKSTGKFVYVSCLSPYVILGIFLIRGAMLEGSGIGLRYLFIPTEEKFALVGQGSTWRTAAVQILFSSGVAYGPFLYYGTARGRGDGLVAPSFWIPLANSATSLYAAFTIFLFLGHVATVLGKKEEGFDEVAQSGPTLLFVAFPSMLNFFAGAQFFGVIFFTMAVFLGIDSVFGWVDYYTKMTRDLFPSFDEKFKHWQQVAGIMVFSFIWSLMFCMEGGIWSFNWYDDYCSSVQLLVCLFSQCIFIPYVFGIHKLSEMIHIRTGSRVPKFYVLVIKTFVPLFGFIMLHFGYTGEFSAEKYAKAQAQSLTDGHFWGLRLLIIIPGILFVIGIFYPHPDIVDIHVLIEEQYGIVLKDKETLPLWHYLTRNECDIEEKNPALIEYIRNNQESEAPWVEYKGGVAGSTDNQTNQVLPVDGKAADGATLN